MKKIWDKIRFKMDFYREVQLNIINILQEYHQLIYSLKYLIIIVNVLNLIWLFIHSHQHPIILLHKIKAA